MDGGYALLMAGAALTLLAGIAVWIRHLERSAAREVRRRWGGEGIRLMDERANCFGIESAGRAQVRGNGCLALTESALVFLLWLPRRETRIPRERILGVDTPRSHLGKTRGGRLLKVGFRTREGRRDSAAWQVRDLQAWLRALTPPPLEEAS